jgi:outer membrane protein insertion porin family
MRRAGRPRPGLVVAAAALAVLAGTLGGRAEPLVVTAVDLVSPHRLPEGQVREAIGELVGRPRSRAAIRESLGRLWALGLFDAVQVEEVKEPGGLRLAFRLSRRPLVRRVAWRGEPSLDLADLAAAAGLATGGDASPDRLARARADLLDLYRREGFVDARVEVTARADPEANAQDVTIAVEAGAPARIGRLRLRDAPAVPKPALEKSLGVGAGDPYREPALREGVRALEARLRQEGFFAARVTAAPPAPDPVTRRVDVEVAIAAGPRYRVRFEGNVALADARLRERLTFRDSGVVDEFELEASARQIEAAYREQGHHFARVTASLEREDEAPLIRFRVSEGPQVRVESVDVTGTEAVPAEELRAQVQTRPPGFLQKGLFRQDVLEADVAALVAFLRARGVAEPRVGPPAVEFSADRRRARITIPVVEGARLTVGRVAVEGTRALAPAELLPALPLRAGAPWSQAQTEEGRRVLERLYARRGFHAAAAEVETARRERTVDVTYRVREGAPTRIGRILVRGLILTDERVVRRVLPFAPGDRFDPDRLLEGQRRLAELGIFEVATIGPLRPPPAPFADVEVTVRERKPWRVELGAGFATDEGIRGFLEAGHDNLFGTGRSLSLRQKVSGTGERTDFAERTDLLYRERWLFGTPWQADVNLFREQRDEIGFFLERFGGELGGQRELFPEWIRGLRGAIAYRLEDVRRSDVDPALAAEDVVAGRQLVATLGSTLTLDRRDDPLDPTRGSLHLLSLEGGGSLLGGDVDFVRTRLESHWFLDWLPPTVVALSARLGLAGPIGDTAAIPIEQRFFAGGATSIRGYRENRVGPRDAAGNPAGGDALVVLSAEWRVPLGQRWLAGAVFVDAGAVTREVGDLGLDELRAGAGVGLRVRTPVGPLRFDVGYALRPIPGERRTQFYLTVGYPF